jgi:hypothetical protein
MIINHLVLSNVRLVIFRRIKFMLGLKNITLPDITMFKNNGIPLYGE